MPTLYNANIETLEYMPGCESEAHINPMYSEQTHDKSEKYIYNKKTASLVPPIECGENEKVYLIDGRWVAMACFIGEEYWEKDGTKHVISEVGETFPAGKIQTPPPSEFHTTNNGKVWIFNKDLYRSKYIDAVSKKRRLIIDHGVIIDGTKIQSDDGSYSNMMGYIGSDVDIFWECRDGSYKVYTPDEFKLVFNAVTKYRNECFKFAKSLIDNLTTTETTDPVNVEEGWPPSILATNEI